MLSKLRIEGCFTNPLLKLLVSDVYVSGVASHCDPVADPSCREGYRARIVRDAQGSATCREREQHVRRNSEGLIFYGTKQTKVTDSGRLPSVGDEDEVPPMST